MTRKDYKGKTVRIKKDTFHHQHANFGGSEYRVEDYWDNLTGKSWQVCDGNMACLMYSMRIGMIIARFGDKIPMDDEVLYGKIGPFGHLVHVSEIEEEEQS